MQKIKCILIFFIFVLLSSCSSGKQNLPQVKARFINPDSTITTEFTLMVAANDQRRQKGLMYVKNMPELEGMLFLFPEQQELSFWMRNTYISLDMLFIDQNFVVKGILPKVPILNDQPRGINEPTKFVVELNAGIADKYKIVQGARLEVLDALPVIQ